MIDPLPMDEAALISARKHASRHRYEIMASSTCGCFHCQQIFRSTDVVGWTDEGTCAACPECGAPSVIGDASGLPVGDPAFLAEMHERWFGRPAVASAAPVQAPGGGVESLVLEHLRGLRAELARLSDRVDGLVTDVAATASRLEQLERSGDR